MSTQVIGPLKLHIDKEAWPLAAPFRISGYTFTTIDVVLVRLEKDGIAGRGEGAGVYYKQDTPAKMMQQLEAVRGRIEQGLTGESTQTLLPPGGARNALDAAFWDLQAKLTGRRVWQLAGIEEPRPLLTTFTCGADNPETMARAARSYSNARAIKLKLTGEPVDADRVRAVRGELPSVWLGVDANQGFTRTTLEQLMPCLEEARVALIEQPFPIGQEAELDGFESSIPIAADESVQCLADVPHLVGRFQVVNIKLDKCGGLTEGLAMVKAASAAGLKSMVGNMLGTSLAMAPAYLLGQLCSIVDLDGPIFLARDRPSPIKYVDGRAACSQELWG